MDYLMGKRFKWLADRLAAGLAVLTFVLGLGALTTWRVDLGVRLGYDGEYVRIEAVAPQSPARREGFAAGMIVVSVNGATLVRLPGDYYENLDVFGNPVGDGPVQVDEPTIVPLDPGYLSQLLTGPVGDLTAIPDSDLQAFAASYYGLVYVGSDYVGDLGRAAPGLILGAALLLVGAWWLAGGRAGASLTPFAVPLAVATAMPFLVWPLEATWSGPALAIVGVFLPLSMIPLALRFAGRIADESVRLLAIAVALGCAVAAVLIGGFSPVIDAGNGPDAWVWPALVAAIPLVPGLAAAIPIRPVPPPATSSGGLVRSTELAVAGATPMMAIATVPAYDPFFIPFSLWLVLIAVAGRWTIRPLARLATRATLQRDLVVAATEAERARVAADIHDDALQELTLLVRRLETAGDEEGAGMARTVSDRLRAICGALRLPILDDLGVGPALDWLVLRIERLAGGEVRLEKADGTRPPPDVELAIFRVAQEALGNAVKHGKPPIVVRYHATEAGASLSVDDAGPGIEPDAPARAEQEGRFGLLNMQQRAEGIGAILDVRRWPGGGTHVALEWRPH
ncbi:MAG: ATP-binding protein [Chloroflexota bacterium]